MGESRRRNRIAVLANPASGRGKSTRMGNALVAALSAAGAAPELLLTQRGGDARRFPVDFADDFDLWIACGGDGTFAETVGGVLESGSDAPVTVAPAGTANVMARALGISGDLTRLVRRVLEKRVVLHDVGWLVSTDSSPRPFLMSAGSGLDAEAVEAVHRHRNGPIRLRQYLLPVWRAARRGRPAIHATIDGEPCPLPATFVLAANVKEYGGRLSFCPSACSQDGMLDFFACTGQGKLDWFRHWLAGLRHDNRDTPQRWRRSAFQATWTAESPENRIPVQADGDPAGFLPATIQIKPKAVRLV